MGFMDDILKGSGGLGAVAGLVAKNPQASGKIADILV